MDACSVPEFSGMTRNVLEGLETYIWSRYPASAVQYWE